MIPVKPLRKILQVPEDVAIKSYLKFFLWQKVLGFNRSVPWTVHFTSTVIAWQKISLGRASYPGDMPNCYIQGNNGIVIGDYCLFGPGVGLISANHDLDEFGTDSHAAAKPIRIGNRCWIGMNAVVLPGVQLGDKTIVGAGSVVTKSFPEGNCVIAGNPAKIVRELS